MAYNYIGLVNDVALRLNETEISQAEFVDTSGVYNAFKEAVNASIRHVNQEHFFWPFNHNQADTYLSPGVSRYALPDNAKYVDFGSFRVRRNADLNVATGKKLEQMAYEEYLRTYIDQEYETDSTKGGVPRYVVRTPDRQYVIVPMPDKNYQIDYEYYMTPFDLELFDDTPTIPESYRHIVVDGAMYYAYMFRDNLEQATIAQRKFEDGLKNMRSILVNEYAYFRAF